MEEGLRILMLEDQEFDAVLIERALKKDGIKFVRVRVDTEDEFEKELKDFVPDVILSDHSMPQFNSIEALRICKKMGSDVPFILVTGTVSEEFAVSCLKQGASDYVLKSNLSRLSLAIRYALQQRDQELNRIKQEELLRIQNHELRKINNELDAFVYNISHNLRAPLTSVMGLTRVARIDPDNSSRETFDGYLTLIEKSMNQLDGTLKEILDYAQNSRNEITSVNIDFSAIFENAVKKVNYVESFNTVAKKLYAPAENSFHSDPVRLEILFVNLISNAIQFRDESKGHPHLAITISLVKDGVTLEFHDNGIGIDSTYHDKVFNMFFRASERSSGAGLGLYIVKEVIAKMKGTIKMVSRPGLGTTIELFIPGSPTNREV